MLQSHLNRSPAELIALLPSSEERRKYLHKIAPTLREAKLLDYCWRFWARPKQLPPAGDWFVWLLLSGRGFGKTRAGSEWVIDRARNGPFHPIALVGQTKADVRDTMMELGDSSLLKISPSWFMPKYEPSKRRLTWPNGMIAIVYSGDEPDQLRGPQHGSAWVDELAKFKYPQETWDNLVMGLRVGEKPQAVVTTTPRPIPIIKALVADPDTASTVGSTYENLANLSPIFIQQVIRRYEGTRLGRQELHGAILDDVEGALWTRALLEETRVSKYPDLVRIVVGVDPQGSTTSGAETGIVGAGLGVDDQGYVLDDASLNGTPHEWGSQAVAAMRRLRADRIVAEVNYGGDMVESTIRTVDENAPIKLVRATRGKLIRAEPVQALYEQGRVHHVGMFASLEDELCSWVQGEKSPNRLDAMVWALTELMVGGPIEAEAMENPFY